MATKIKLDPVTRLEGHMKVEVEINSQNEVVAAKSTGNMFRGFENILRGRDPRDAVHITQRICGLCPVSHGIAAVKAIEGAENYRPGMQAKLLRNLIEGANYLSGHILHFYHLALQDYVKGPDQGIWRTNYNTDMRFSKGAGDAIFSNYIKALEIRRKAHEMAAILGGKIPHVMSIMPGGVTKMPTAQEISRFKTLLLETKSFIYNQYYEDMQKVASVYADYFQIGKGCGNLISIGVFELEDDKHFFRSGRYTDGKYMSVDINKITEHVKYAWYEDSAPQGVKLGATQPRPDKAAAYSWIKSPRYQGIPHEAGPLARMWLNGDYRKGISVMDRHVARMLEAKKLAHAMVHWVNRLQPEVKDYDPNLHKLSRQGAGVGVTEAPRGILVHYLKYNNTLIENYQIITPTCWNASPMDDAGTPGPMEQALVGVKMKDPNNPVELMRIVHSFDPCTACAVHVITPEKKIANRFVVSLPG